MRDKIERILPVLREELGPVEQEISDDPLGELVHTILSQNSTDSNSGAAYERLLARYSTWREVRDAPRADLEAVIHIAGLSDVKARTIQETLRQLPVVNGEPSLEEIRSMDNEAAAARMMAFRGVGVKTAACVLLFGLGRDVFPVDTHVHRVSNRLGLVRTTSRDKTHAAMKPMIPEGKGYEFHVLLVRFGRRVCKAQNPRCHVCPLYDECCLEERHAIAARNRQKGLE